MSSVALNSMGLFLRRPPKLVVRTLVATSSAIGLVLVAVFVVLSMDARNRIAGTAGESLDVAERAFADLDQHRQQETLIKLNALAENRGLGDAACALSSGRQAVSIPSSARWIASRESWASMPWS